ncbi:hypothetical protein ACHRVW_04215 [Flavobacterium collinsii]|uniref:Uncharacterized protein n=1 Tax=Flavobacterium collinsii TaxID=1114861 RepID=A0A9W4TEI6_9FLAO|nr:hypothetical protein [Flavobacterium collinsii]CAI2766519.1 conserved protein of unknown function [Flavobacterium collinsii]
MRLQDLKNKYEISVFNESLDENLVGKASEWEYYSAIRLNGIIAVGWLSDDNILLVNTDGVFIYDILKKNIIFSDYENSFKKNISDDNLTFYVQTKSETVFIFGLRGGGGNLLTKDNIWKIEVIDIACNIKVPKLLNYKNGKKYFLELQQNSYEGNKYLGFSKSENYFLIMGDGGLDVFSRLTAP